MLKVLGKHPQNSEQNNPKAAESSFCNATNSFFSRFNAAVNLLLTVLLAERELAVLYSHCTLVLD